MDKVLKTLLLQVDISTFSGGFSIFVSPSRISAAFLHLSSSAPQSARLSLSPAECCAVSRSLSFRTSAL